MSYGASAFYMARRMATYIDKILKAPAPATFQSNN